MTTFVRIGHRILPFDGKSVGEMRETQYSLLASDPGSARARMATDGYLLFRSALPREAVARACAAVTKTLGEAGWLAEGGHSSRTVRSDFREYKMSFNGYSIEGPDLKNPERIADPKMGPSATKLGGFHGLQNDPDVRSLLHCEELFDLAGHYFGEAAGCLDYRWMRAVLPDQLVGHGYHMDNVYMGRGSSRLHTFWIPLHEISCDKEGGLILVEGSNQRPGFRQMRETFGMQEQFGSFGQDPAEVLANDPEARWVTCRHFRPGDVVCFPMHTLHGGVTNSTGTVRLSVDTRLQPLSEPSDPRFPMHSFSLDTPEFAAEDFIAQQADMTNPLGSHRLAPAFEGSLEEAKVAWGLAGAPRLQLPPDPVNPPTANPKL